MKRDIIVKLHQWNNREVERTGTLVKGFQIFYTAGKSLPEPVARLKPI